MITLRVWGDYALFTRPEFKVERVSYEVPTASACRGILSAVYWKPQIHWQIRRIAVMKPIRWINLMRNEVSAVASAASIDTAMRHSKPLAPIVAESVRQQRHGRLLYDVEYVIEADILPSKQDIRARGTTVWADHRERVKHYEIAKRRIACGKCARQPVLGTRENVAWFEEAEFPATGIPETRDLGVMLYDLDWPSDYGESDAPCVSFFSRQQMTNGIVDFGGFDPVVSSLLYSPTRGTA